MPQSTDAKVAVRNSSTMPSADSPRSAAERDALGATSCWRDQELMRQASRTQTTKYNAARIVKNCRFR